MTTSDEDEPSDGMTVGKTRRVVFTALAVAMLIVVVDFVCGWSDEHWQELFYHRPFNVPSWIPEARFSHWQTLLWVIPCLGLLPILLLALAEHDSPSRALRDVRLCGLGAVIFFSLVCAALLGSHNGMPASTAQEYLDMVTVHRGWVASLKAERVSPLWLAIPTTLTIAFIIASARRRAIGDAAQLAAGEEE